MMRYGLAAAWIALGILIAPAMGDANSPAPAEDRDLRSLNLQSRVGDLELVRDDPDGELRVHHNGHSLSAAEYLALIETQQQRRDAGGPLFSLFNITTWVGVLWVAVGLLGQVLFTGRMLVQWLASEKHKRSVVPPIFWHMSLAGATMLLVYFVWRKDIVGVLGQSTGWAIYARNVVLLRKHPITVTKAGDTDSNLAPGQ